MSSEESISGQSRKFTPLDTEYSYAGFQFVHAPYTIVEGLSVQGRSPEDYIVAQWFEESDEFDGEFSYNHRNHQPSIANNGSVITPSKAINPFKDESILPKILNMDPRNDDEIIAFYNEYGPLDQTSTLSDISPIARCAQMNGILESRKFFIQSVIEIQTVIEGLDILEDINVEPSSLIQSN